MNDGYNLSAARYSEQKAHMKSLAERNVCAFCYQNIPAEQKNPIELETKHWVVKKNDYPYEHTSLHLIMIPKQHVSTFSQLTTSAQADFGRAITETENHFNLDSYAIGMRSGDFRYNGGSVEHIHAHIVVGERDQEHFQAVRFKMSSRP